MDQSLTTRLVFGVTGVLITLFVIWIKRSSKFSIPMKIGIALVLLFFLQGTIRTISLLTFYELVVGTTNGISNPIKQTSTKVRYEFYYQGRHYESSEDYEEGVIVNGGKYYVRIAKNFPYINEKDFSMSVDHPNVRNRKLE